jgi:hypothetical protein
MSESTHAELFDLDVKDEFGAETEPNFNASKQQASAWTAACAPTWYAA